MFPITRRQRIRASRRFRAAKPSLEILEAMHMLSVNVNAFVNLLDGPHSNSSANNSFIYTSAHGVIGHASASALGMQLDAESQGGDDPPSRNASGSGSGIWPYTIEGVPPTISVPINFVYQTITDVNVDSLPKSSSLGQAIVGYIFYSGLLTQKGSLALQSYKGAITYAQSSGELSSVHTASTTVKHSSYISGQISTVSTGTADATSIGHAGLKVLGFSSTSKTQYPNMRLRFDDGTVMAPYLVSVEQLRKIMPTLSQVDALRYIDPLNNTMAKFEINSPKRAAAFLSQIALESTSLTEWLENPSRYSGANFEKYDGNPILGNTEAGDGKRYRGGGPLHITGRYNYTYAGLELSYDFANNPGLVSDPSNPLPGFQSAGWFWTRRVVRIIDQQGVFRGVVVRDNNINQIADMVDPTNSASIASINKQVTGKINPALINVSERLDFYKKALIVLNAK